MVEQIALFLHNKPGMLSRIDRILGEKKINSEPPLPAQPTETKGLLSCA